MTNEQGGTENHGNVVALEHVNIRVPDQGAALQFYVDGLGLVRDPDYATGLENMWINIGRSQFHLPTGQPQVLRGHVGLVLPDREALLRRLREMERYFADTRFGYEERDPFVEVTSPWGNRLRLFEPGGAFGDITAGMGYIEFNVPAGAAGGIARFYDEILGSRTEVTEDSFGRLASCSVGQYQRFVFRETEQPIPDYDGHHVQVYLADISVAHEKLSERNLVYEASDPLQFRFKDIVDPETGELLFELEHEIRSTAHPLFARSVVNRVAA